MLHVFVDALAAAVESRQLLGGQRQFNHLLHTIRPDHAGHTGKQPRLTLLTAKLRAGRHDGFFIVQHDVRHPRCGGRNAVFRAELPGECDPSAADGLLLECHPIKAEPFISLRPDVQRHPAEAHAGPWRKLLVSVLSQHVAGDRLVVDPGLPRKRAQQARRIQSRAGAEHTPRGNPSSSASSRVTMSQGFVILISTPSKPLSRTLCAYPRTAGIV